MRRSRVAPTLCLVLASLSTFTLAGPIGISDYVGPRFPYSASFITSSAEVDFDPPYEQHDTTIVVVNPDGARSDALAL